MAAIVTGAGSGLGAATAAVLSERGAKVFGLDRPGVESPSGAAFELLEADVTKPDEVRDAVTTAAGAGHPLRTVVCCAGKAPSIRILGRSGVHDLDRYAQVISVNPLGTFNVLALAAEEIAKTDPMTDGLRGVAVLTASIAAYEGQIGQVAYAASKGGVVSLTLPAARDLAQHDIRVNSIAPGIVAKPMLAAFSDEIREGLAAGVPFPHRLAPAEEFARAALFFVDHD